MSDGLSKRLRDAAYRAKREYPEVFRVSEEIAYEAADRILKLEAALREITLIENQEYGPDWEEIDLARTIARKALEGKDD